MIMMIIIVIILVILARSICGERVHGVCCWSKSLWTDDFLPTDWLVGKSCSLHSLASDVLSDPLRFVQCLLLNARDISIPS